LLCAYPLELFLADAPAAFDRGERSHRIYQALLDWAGVRPLFRTDQPSVEVGALQGEGRGYAVLANHGGQNLSVSIDTVLPIRSAAQITNAGPRPVTLDGHRWKMTLGPYEGAIFEYRQ
jgi:hypothetical protein